MPLRIGLRGLAGIVPNKSILVITVGYHSLTTVIRWGTSSMSSVSMEEHQRVVQGLEDVKALQTQMMDQMKLMQACFATIAPDSTFAQIQVPSQTPRASDPHSSGIYVLLLILHVMLTWLWHLLGIKLIWKIRGR